MQLYVNVIVVSAGTSEPAGDPMVVACPPDVAPETVLSFLTQKFGEPIDTAWTCTDQHPRITTGWVFPGEPATATDPALEFICVPLVRAGDGTLQPLFELHADQRREFDELAADGAFDGYAVAMAAPRQYQPAAGGARATSGDAAGRAGPGGNGPRGGGAAAHQTLTQLARDTGATTYGHPRPRRAVQRLVLRDARGERGTQFEVAQIEEDGTLRVIGHDEGPGVTEFFGAGTTSYEWIYTVPPDRVDDLATLAGRRPGQDALYALAAYYQRTDGQLSELFDHPQVAAEFSNWHS